MWFSNEETFFFIVIQNDASILNGPLNLKEAIYLWLLTYLQWQFTT